MGVLTLFDAGHPVNGDDLDADVIRTQIAQLLGYLQALDLSNGIAGSIIESSFPTALNPRQRLAETTQKFVLSGLNPSGWTGLVVTFPAGVVYINGYRVVVAGAGFTVSINQDTYFDVDVNGVLWPNGVSNNAASPSLAANRIRLNIIISNGTTITQINPGGFVNTAGTPITAPVISGSIITVSDSLGNVIYPLSPALSGSLIAARHTAAVYIGQATGYVLTELATTIIVPPNRMVEIGVGVNISENGTSVSETTRAKVVLDGSTTILQALGAVGGITTWNSSFPTARESFSLAAGSHALTVNLNVENSGLLSTDNSGAGGQAFLEVKLV